VIFGERRLDERRAPEMRQQKSDAPARCDHAGWRSGAPDLHVAHAAPACAITGVRALRRALRWAASVHVRACSRADQLRTAREGARYV
jgi:hypothetical protein